MGLVADRDAPVVGVNRGLGILAALVAGQAVARPELPVGPRPCGEGAAFLLPARQGARVVGPQRDEADAVAVVPLLRVLPVHRHPAHFAAHRSARPSCSRTTASTARALAL